MNGSCATTRMPNARARCATSWPMRPRPATPSVLPRSSVPRNFFFSHLPSFIARSAAGTDRASASISAQACSATLMLLAPGALTTRMPRALAAATSTLSTPVPARATMRRRGAASSSARVDLRRAADEQRVGVGEVGGEGGRRSAGARVDHPAGLGAEQLQRRGRQVVGDDDFHRRWRESGSVAVRRRRSCVRLRRS